MKTRRLVGMLMMTTIGLVGGIEAERKLVK